MKKILTIVFLALCIQPVFCQCETDYEALMAIYNATNGDNWHDNTNWGVGCQPCVDRWKGVGCQEIDGELRVTSLNLFSNNLVGELPPEINQLSEIQFINMYQNKLNGAIPIEFGQLSKLLWISMFSNEFTDTIPSEIGQLTNLVYLALDYNELTGSIPNTFGQLSVIQNLSLSGNNLTGIIPSELGELSKLKTLDLENNNLTGNIPLELGQLTNLENLELRHNQLSGSIPATLSQLTNLETLFLGNNQLSGCIPYQFDYFCNQSQITVSLFGNQNLEEDNFSDFCATQSGSCEDPCVVGCCCNGELDNEAPVIVGFNPDAAWQEKGVLNFDTLSITSSMYNSDLFQPSDITFTDNCTDEIEIILNENFDFSSICSVCYEEPCFSRYTYIWSFIDQCNNISKDTLKVFVLDDKPMNDIVGFKNSKTYEIYDDIQLGDTITLICGVDDINVYEDIIPDLPFYPCFDGGHGPSIKKRTKPNAFSECAFETWTWQIEGSCRCGVIGEVKLHFKFENPCGCNGTEDIIPPTITGFDPNASWANLGIMDVDTFKMKSSDYDLSLFSGSDISVFDNCDNPLTTILEVEEKVEGDGFFPGSCYYKDKYKWTVIDECGNQAVDSLFVKVLCNDIRGIGEFRDSNGIIYNEINPGDTIRLPCNAALSFYDSLYPYINEESPSCNAGATPKIRKRTKSNAFSECNNEVWTWEIEAGCSAITGDTIIEEIKLFFEFENKNCEQDLVVSGSPIQTNIYEAEQTITSDGVINTNSTVVFKAGNIITLKNGFYAKVGCDFTAQIGSVNCTTSAVSREGIQSIIDNTAFLRCFPNPVHNNLTINFRLNQSKEIVIQLYELSGKEVFSLQKEIINPNIAQQEIIDLSSVADGFYYLILKDKDEFISEKIVVLK